MKEESIYISNQKIPRKIAITSISQNQLMILIEHQIASKQIKLPPTIFVTKETSQKFYDVMLFDTHV